MKSKLVMALTIILLWSGFVQAAPPEIEHLNQLPNAGQLYLDYCAVGHHICVTVKAICYGQCCDQSQADDMGYGCSGDIDGIVPPGFHYAGWSCQIFDTGQTFKGLASQSYDHSKCNNPR